MIITDTKLENERRRQDPQPSAAEPSTAGASGSWPAPPPFHDEPSSENDHLLVDFTGSGSASRGADEHGLPPAFAPYEAEHSVIDSGDVVSHDPHLNSDGEALYRFLLSEDERSPYYRVHCSGTHSETRHRWVTSRDKDGQMRSHRESYTETITDFDFYIIIHPPMTSQTPVHWTVADDVPAYRGRMVRECEEPAADGAGVVVRKAKKEELKSFKAWNKERVLRGLPPWIGSTSGWTEGMPLHTDTMKSSKTVRQWADEYCASRKHLKEFVYEKTLYGWDIPKLESVIRSTIATVPYNGKVDMSFTPCRSKVYIRPNNRISRMLSNKWLKFLSIILFIFPFIWLFKRFNSRGGGTWAVCGSAYAMKLLVDEEGQPADDSGLPSYEPSTLGSTAGASASSMTRYVQSNGRTKRVIGIREGEWFRKWEGPITRAVSGRYQSNTPLPDPEELRENILLDGYHD